MEVLSLGSLLFVVLAISLFCDIIGGNNGNNNHPTRHHRHSDREIANFSDARRSRSVSGLAMNRLQNGAFFDTSIRTIIKATTTDLNTNDKKMNHHRVFERMNELSLSHTKAFVKDPEDLISRERESNYSNNASKTDFILNLSLINKTIDDSDGINNKVAHLESAKDKGFKKVLLSTVTINLLPGYDRIIEPTSSSIHSATIERSTATTDTDHDVLEIHLSRNERETFHHNPLPKRDFENAEGSIKNSTSRERMPYAVFDKRDKVVAISALDLTASKHLQEDDETSSMFMRHNITVESLNHSSEKERKGKLSLDRKNSDSNDESTWNISFEDGKGNLNNTSTKIYAQVGGDALLPCRVGHLGDRQVSWIRRRDWFVLTSGNSLYTHDERFGVLHEHGSQDWTLHIKRSLVGDSGVYECQVSTGTGIISFFVRLEVVTPTAHIPGNGRTHVYRGSPFTIYCYIVKSPSEIQHVIWHHDGTYLNYKRASREFSITTRVQRSRHKGGSEDDFQVDYDYEDALENDPDKNVVISRLKVNFATENHSGNYTCSAPNVVPDSILIYVTEGDKTAAVQRIDSGANRRETSFTLMYTVAIFITCGTR